MAKMKKKKSQKTTTRQDENKPILMTATQLFVYTFIPCMCIFPPSDARLPDKISFSCASRHYKQNILQVDIIIWSYSHPNLIPQNVDEIIPK